MTSGRPGVTYDDVVKAISRLQKKKINVTGDNIRYELGAGSKTTITKHLQKWRLNQPRVKREEASLRKDMIKLLKIMATRLNVEVVE